jgi:hypothetical protein
MIKLPDFKNAWEYENQFYLSCKTQRISKFIAHYELYKKTLNLSGEIVECGVFKGVSLSRWAHFREMFGGSYGKKIIGFDIYGSFPKTNFSPDNKKLDAFIDAAGDQSISTEQMRSVLMNKEVNHKVELIKGDITKTVPQYVLENPELKISLLNLDTDIYEPAVTILEKLYPRIVKGGILILDDYGVFPGETKAVDEYFKDNRIQINKFPHSMTPSYIIVE